MIRLNPLSEIHLRPREIAQGLAMAVSLLLLGALLAVAAGCGGAHRQSPPNVYVDGPLLVAESRELAADLLDAKRISSTTARQVRTYGDLVLAGIAAGQAAATAGDTATEHATLLAVQEALAALRTFTQEHRP